MTNVPTKETRRLPSWIESFLEFTDDLASPPIFRKWAAISAIAGALERKVWVKTQGSNLYPNLYIILVGPPGVGKTMVSSVVEDLWNALPDHHVAPSSVTKASLVDTLADAKRSIVRPGEVPPYVEFNSLLVVSNELGVFLPSYESDFMSVLTDIYDGKRYAERRRTKDHKLNVDRPQINILASTTPSYLSSMLPDGAWDQGFTSRTLFIFAGQKIIKPLFGEYEVQEEAQKDLVHDLKIIGSLYGKISFSPEAAEAIGAWHMAGGPPAPEHPKLVHYITRRTAHLLKLSMVACASRGNDLVISIEDYNLALNWLYEAEHFMPDIFRSMNSGGDSKAIEDCWYYVFSLFAKEKKPIAESRILNFLSGRVPAYNVANVLNIMVSSGQLKKEAGALGNCYSPAPRQQHH